MATNDKTTGKGLAARAAALNAESKTKTAAKKAAQRDIERGMRGKQ